MSRPKSCLPVKLQPWQESVQTKVKAKGKLCRSSSTLKAPVQPALPSCSQPTAGLNLSDFVTEPLRLKAQSRLYFLRNRKRAFLKLRLNRGPVRRILKPEKSPPDLSLLNGSAQHRTAPPLQLTLLRQRLSLGYTRNEPRGGQQEPGLMVALGVKLTNKLCHSQIHHTPLK